LIDSIAAASEEGQKNMFSRLRGLVTLMSIRLVVSTLAMLCLLTASAASAVAGASPWLLNKLFQIGTGEDFHFTAKKHQK